MIELKAMLRCIVILLAALVAANASAGNIYLEEFEGPPHMFRLSGPIEDGDLQKLKAAYESVDDEPDSEFPWVSTSQLLLNSPGGSLSEALKMGRWLRENRFSIVLPVGSRCYSACVYLLAAGVQRVITSSEVGIHRPYLNAQPEQGIDTSMRSMLTASRAYFDAMNITPGLADEMFSTPPESLRILSDSELSKYRLNQTDLAYREKNDLANAAMYGMSRSEYLEAERKADIAVRMLCQTETTLEFVRCNNEIRESLGLVIVE